MNKRGGGMFPIYQLVRGNDVRLPDQVNRMMVRLLVLVRMIVGKWKSRRMWNSRMRWKG
jgi:hypothetical protein